MPKLLISCETYLSDEGGADLEYQKCIQSAATLNGWDCRVLIPEDAAADAPNWLACLPRTRGSDAAWRRLYRNCVRLPLAIQSACRKELAGQPQHLAIMAQSLTGSTQILGLALAAVSLRQYRPHLMVVVRTPVHQRLRTAVFYRLADALARLSGISTSYFTDTQALASALERFLGRPLTLIPIPHTQLLAPLQDEARREILCWWPGPPREEKGLQVVKRLAQTVDRERPKIRLMLAASSGVKAAEKDIAVEVLPDVLKRDDYMATMRRAALLLLPYDSAAYRERSSGIFVEAIVAGKAVAVSPDTWMAAELKRHGLERFIWDWQAGDLPDLIRRTARELSSGDAFASIRAEYRARHNISQFAETLKHSWRD